MPELPGVSEDFTADASGYVAAVQLMIDRTKDLIDEVSNLHAAIDALPDLKQVEIAIAGDAMESIAAIKEELDSLDNRTLVVNVIYRNTGGPGDITHGTVDETVNVTGGGSDQIREDIDALDEMTQTLGENADATALDSAAQQILGNILRDTSLNAQQQAAALKNVTAAMREARIETADAAGMTTAAMEQEALAAYNVDQALKEARAEVEEITAAQTEYSDSLGNLNAEEELLAQEQIHLAEHQEALIQAAYGAEAAARAESEAMNALAADLGDTNSAILQSVDHTLLLARGDQQLAAGAQLLADAQTALGLRTYDSASNLAYFQKVIAAAGGDVNAFNANVHGGMGTMLAFALAAKSAGDNVGGILIPLTAASFGITGLGTAIHLITMGIFEFSAVFIPAMVAAGAAAAVLNQGFLDVYDGLKGMEIAGEALGPIFGKTQGDMLGLGHSLQIAQNAADPDAYEILGEAIIGVNDATGHLNDQLGAVTHTAGTAAGGISVFGQMGLAVGNILEKFAADIDIDLQNGMKQFTGLLADGAQDLVEFGQILGNIGHAILNLASAMPGLAEIVLKIIDGFSDLIKVISELPPIFLTVVFGIEEAYRWSGLLVGVFGLVGRAIALVGTLGIPVFAKIGMNFGAMVSNIALGVAGMITNFGALVSRITGGDGVIALDSGMASVARGFGGFAEFMSGPWGAAVGLGVLGFAALAVWALRSSDATQQFIASTQKAVQAASNLTALNVIGTELSDNTTKITQAQAQLSESFDNTMGTSAGVESRYVGQSQAVTQLRGNIQILTDNQQKLYQQSTNVISGAEQISQAYGVSFTAALGMADAANVKLVDGISGNSKAAEEARIQIQGLVQGYMSMNQSGTALSNSMDAVSVQTQIQGSKVSALNSAWDSFMSMATSLTGSFSQINLDLEQMGNIASTTPAKIGAFAGTTTLSVKQIAESLKSFSGTSAQTWQAYNQSLSEAETFTDNLRTASTTGVVSATQYTQAISGIVNMFLPFAKDSSSAAAELSVLAQEAGGPAVSTFAGLKSWVDQTGGSTVNLTGLVNNLTGSLSNVTQVAKNFAGTLQSDVLSAIANAATGTSGITGLTQKYTQSLQQNGAQSPITMQAQQSLMGAMEKLGFTETEAQQTTNELSEAYDQNTGASNKNAGQANQTTQAQKDLKEALGIAGSQAVQAAGQTNQTTQAQKDFKEALGQSGTQAQQTASGPLNQLNQITQNIHQWTLELEDAMKKWPSNEATKVTVTGTGGASIHSSIPGVSGGNITVAQFGLGLAAGGVLPGYAPGHDTIPAMLSPGEGILTPDAVKAIGGASAIHSLNAKHFAGGGIALPNVSGTAAGILGSSTTTITDGFKAVMTSAMNVMQNDYNKYAQTAFAGVSGTVTGWLTAALKADGAPLAWLPALAWLTNAESGGNPLAVDPVAVEGEHATGLLQTLPSTFWAYENPSVPGGIDNPIANAAAAIRYIETMYGTPFNIPGMFVHDKGYDSGGWLMPGLTLAHNNTGQPEKVIGPNGGDDGGVNHVHVYLDGKQIWENQQRRTLQYDARNNGSGNVTGAWAPNRRGNNTR
jgi:SLT domain-containing protein